MKHQATSQPATPISSGSKQASPYAQLANKFRKQKGWKSYVMEPKEELGRVMKDDAMPKEVRILAGIKLHSWGNLSDYAVDRMPAVRPNDPKPSPFTQKQMAEIIGIQESSMSQGVQNLRELGYLRNHRFLFPEDSVKPLESSEFLAVTSDCMNSHSPFLRFEQLAIQRDPDAKIIPSLVLERKKFHDQAAEVSRDISKRRRHILSLWKDTIERGRNPLDLDDKTIASLMESTKDTPAA